MVPGPGDDKPKKSKSKPILRGKKICIIYYYGHQSIPIASTPPSIPTFSIPSIYTQFWMNFSSW